MDYLKDGADDIVLLFKDRSTMDKSLAGVGVFCARVVDRLWQGKKDTRSSADHIFSSK